MTGIQASAKAIMALSSELPKANRSYAPSVLCADVCHSLRHSRRAYALMRRV